MVSLWHGYGTDRVCMGYRLYHKKAPLVRGKRIVLTELDTACRNTPAGTGKTFTAKTVFQGI